MATLVCMESLVVYNMSSFRDCLAVPGYADFRSNVPGYPNFCSSIQTVHLDIQRVRQIRKGDGETARSSILGSVKLWNFGICGSFR